MQTGTTMTTHVMNSAIMPSPGTYTLQLITKEQFVAELKLADALSSSIGYPQNLEFIKKISGIDLPLSRKETLIKSGDSMLILKLKYRVDGYPKGMPVSENDFEFFKATFE